MKLIMKSQVTEKERQRTARKVDPKEIEMGIEVELEHTSSRAEARKIALDHLAENPAYYSELKEAGLNKAKGYPPGTIRTHGGVKKMKTVKGGWVPVSKLKQKADKPAGKQVKHTIDSPKEDWKKNGVKAKVFKSWFGDWENDPANASKVVDDYGAPQEQYNTGWLDPTPSPVYHGTGIGGYTKFDIEKVSEGSLYGRGFYFTEDKGIAEEYIEKEDPSENVEIDHTFAVEESDSIRAYIEEISNSPRFKDYSGDAKRTALVEFLQPYGAYRENGRVRLLVDQFVRSALSRGGPMAEDVIKKLDELGVDYEILGKPQVYEVYLNIRNPFDIEIGKVPVSIIPEAERQHVERGGSENDSISYRGMLDLMDPSNRRKKGLAGKTGKEELNKALRDYGYDGLTHIGGRNMGDRLHRVWIAFESTQIKSTDNQGTFDPKDPDITKSLTEVFDEIIKSQGRTAKIGEIRTWSDGRQMKKVAPKKWKRTGGSVKSTSKQREEKVSESGEKTFESITSEHGLPSMVAQEVMEDEFDIHSYDDLVQFVKKNAKKPSKKIKNVGYAGENPLSKMYQRVKSEMESEFSSRDSSRAQSLNTSGENVLKQFAKLLIDLRDAYKDSASEEQKLSVKYETSSGKTTSKYKDKKQSDIPSEKKSAAAKKLKGWNAKKPPTPAQMRNLLKTKWAKKVKGEVIDKTPFEIRGANAGNIVTDKGIVVPFRESEEGVKVYLQQKKVGKRADTSRKRADTGGKRKRKTAVSTVEVTVPYELAEDFLLQNVEQAKTRSNLIGQMKRSAGYKRAIGGE